MSASKSALQRSLRQLFHGQCRPVRALHTETGSQPFRCLHSRASVPPRPTLRPSRALSARGQHRYAGTFGGNAKTLFQRYPFSMALASAAILLGSGTLIYVNYYYAHYIVAPYHNFPEPVAVKLRRAIYYSQLIQDGQGGADEAKLALKYYRQALEVAEELVMDPFSDEVMGIKIRVAAMMELIQQPTKAVQVLEILRRDSMQWVNKFGGQEGQQVKRSRVLAKCVAMSVKLGELYSNPVVYDREAAEERLVWAVETALKETQRRQALGLALEVLEEQEGPWMSSSELGASLEALAHSYEERNQHYLATPLFLQALALNEKQGCHQIVLMNNLATSLAQQSPSAAAAAQKYAQSQTIANNAPTTAATSRETMIKNAKTWAQKALDVAAMIKPPDRDDECDVGCAVALHNLGEFAEMSKDVEDARRRYREAISLARAVGFDEGVEQSSARLRALQG